MQDTPKSEGNTLKNPANIAERLAGLETETDMDHIRRVEIHLAHRIRLGGAITYVNALGEHVIEDRNGMRPFVHGMEFPNPPESAELTIRELAFQHGVVGDRSSFDEIVEKITALSGDDVVSDEVELMLIGLRKDDRCDGIDLTKLHARYLEEVGRSQED